MNFIRQEKNYKGVTLIEVFGVIAIISIFAVISWKQLADNRKHAEVEAVAQEIASLINQTRSYALTGRKVNTGSLEEVPNCFGIAFMQNGSYRRIWIKGECSNESTWINDVMDDGSISSKVNLAGSGDLSIFHVYAVPNGDKYYGYQDITVESKSDSSIQKIIEINNYRAVVK